MAGWSPKGVWNRLNRGIDHWLTFPEPNAAGNMGLFRVLYAMFYLWTISDYTPANLHEVPYELDWPIILNQWIPERPPPEFFELLGTAQVAGLVLLLFGYRTRIATAVVLIAGGLLESYFVSVDIEHASLFLTAYIPFFMLVCGDWGATYSFDALLKRRRGQATVDHGDTSPRFVIPTRACLVLLSALYLSAAIFKVVQWDHWFGQDQYMALDALTRRVEAAMRGFTLNPLTLPPYEINALDVGSRWGIAAFEISVFLAMINNRLRAFYTASALIFHAMSALWFLVTFTSLVVVYCMFINWEALIPESIRRGRRDISAPSIVLHGAPVVAAVLVAFVWHEWNTIQEALWFGGLLDPRRFWFPVFPFACVWWIACLWRLVRDPRAAFRPDVYPAAGARA